MNERMNECTCSQSRFERPGDPRRGFGNARTLWDHGKLCVCRFLFLSPFWLLCFKQAACRGKRGGGAFAWRGMTSESDPTLHFAALGTPGTVVRAETIDSSQQRALVPAATTTSCRLERIPRLARCLLAAPKTPRSVCWAQEQRASKGAARGAHAPCRKLARSGLTVHSADPGGVGV